MLRLNEGTRIYVAAEHVDFRKAINGLSALVLEQFDTPLNDGSVYVFYNQDCNRVKCLFWDKNGFVGNKIDIDSDRNIRMSDKLLKLSADLEAKYTREY